MLAALAAAFVVFWVFDVLDEEDVRAWLDPLGAFAAPAYVVIAALLGLALVPGPVLAATSGLLFGAAVGTIVTLASATLSAVLGVLIARRAAAGDLERLAGERLSALAELARRHGFEAVVVQRLAPGIPDAPATYLFGALRVGVAAVALGTVVGAAPRAFSYTAVGASLDDPGSPLAWAGVGGIVVTAIAGAWLARRTLRQRRPTPPG
jgi:uncharacterized membrane protein YdjX (TVP38/TMEM64 family)